MAPKMGSALSEIPSLVDEIGSRHPSLPTCNKLLNPSYVFTHAVRAPDDDRKLLSKKVAPTMARLVLEFDGQFDTFVWRNNCQVN